VVQCNVSTFNSIKEKFDLISIFLDDSSVAKKDFVKDVVNAVAKDTLVTVNLESLTLLEIQNHSESSVMGMNVSFPVQASPFMEIIRTCNNSPKQIDTLCRIGQDCWAMDPYVCENISVRAYLLAAMTREALSLVDNGYADIESIDRACRNDAGYYLPFAGNFLYMDLMGTMAYALVMKDLNPELTKDAQLPDWLLEKVSAGHQGMESNKGFYNYKEGDFEAWTTIIQEFSNDIRKVINKYKKDYPEKIGP